jgi:hypothetical protein
VPRLKLRPCALLVVLAASGASGADQPQSATSARAQPADAGAEASTRLTLQKVVALAEQFVRACGYTQQPAAEGEPEPGCHDPVSGDISHGSLKGSAVGILRHRKGGDLGWSVAFAYDPSTLRNMSRELQGLLKAQIVNVGRTVTMGPHGENVRIEHVDVKPDAVEPLSRARTEPARTQPKSPAK